MHGQICKVYANSYANSSVSNSQCRIYKSFAYGASDTLCSVHIFVFEGFLSVVLLVNVHHAPKMFLIWEVQKVVLAHAASIDALKFFQ